MSPPLPVSSVPMPAADEAARARDADDGRDVHELRMTGVVTTGAAVTASVGAFPAVDSEVVIVGALLTATVAPV